tara:strand:+ start:953 stop:1213 length:261 start_codon:yes stop_codon:yes gene_type:complete
MTKEEEVVFNNLFEMFNTEGWQQLVRDFTDSGNNINVAELVKDEKDLLFKKGQLNVIAQVVNLKEITTTTYDGIIADELETDNENT